MLCFQGKDSPAISPALLKVITRVAEEQVFSRARVVQAVADLSRLFTKERVSVSQPYLDDPVRAAAYLNYFLPVNLSKVQMLLDEVPVLDARKPLSVLDFGSGQGTAALAVLDWRHRCKQDGALSVVAVDKAVRALRQAEQLWGAYCQAAAIPSASLHAYEADAERGAWLEQINQKAPFDLIILSNCLNEMHADTHNPISARCGLVTKLLSLLAPNGTMMIVEPALCETSRALHHVRDQLLQEKRCTIYSPCLHEHNCPALMNPDDWCHEERSWKAPAVIQQIDDEVGFIKDALKFSYLLLRKDGKTIVERRPDVYRVVSELRELKGDTRAWVCNELGRSEIGRLERVKSEANAAWDDCRRGTIVKLGGMKQKDGAKLARIPDEGKVQIVRPT